MVNGNQLKVGGSLKLPINYKKSSFSVRRGARELYCIAQEWSCYHCGNDLRSVPSEEVTRRVVNIKLFPKGVFNHPIHLHHDHNTGLTIGAVHAKCNAVLWQYYGE